MNICCCLDGHTASRCPLSGTALIGVIFCFVSTHKQKKNGLAYASKVDILCLLNGFGFIQHLTFVGYVGERNG